MIVSTVYRLPMIKQLEERVQESHIICIIMSFLGTGWFLLENKRYIRYYCHDYYGKCVQRISTVCRKMPAEHNRKPQFKLLQS